MLYSLAWNVVSSQFIITTESIILNKTQTNENTQANAIESNTKLKADKKVAFRTSVLAGPRPDHSGRPTIQGLSMGGGDK